MTAKADTIPLRETVEKIDHLLNREKNDAGYQAFVYIRKIWPQLKAAALASEPVAGTVREAVKRSLGLDPRPCPDIEKVLDEIEAGNYRDLPPLGDSRVALSAPPAPTGREAFVDELELMNSRLQRLLIAINADDPKGELLSRVNAMMSQIPALSTGPVVTPHAGATTASALQSVPDEIERKIAQLEHYRDTDCQLDHAKTIAEGRLLQARMDLDLIGKALQAVTPPAPGAADRAVADLSDAPKDGVLQSFEVTLQVRGYWDAELSNWILSRPIRMEFVPSPARYLGPAFPRADRGGPSNV